MKATMRRNGRKMVTVRTEHHVSLELLAQLCLHLQKHYYTHIKTRAQFDEEIRDFLHAHGEPSEKVMMDDWEPEEIEAMTVKVTAWTS